MGVHFEIISGYFGALVRDVILCTAESLYQDPLYYGHFILVPMEEKSLYYAHKVPISENKHHFQTKKIISDRVFSHISEPGQSLFHSAENPAF